MDFFPPALAETVAHARGVVFDIDGVLIDSLTSGSKLFCQTATTFGLPTDNAVQTTFRRHWGMAALELIPACFPGHAFDVAAFYRQWQQYDQEMLHPLLPGVTTTLPVLAANGQVLSLFSNREESTARSQLNGHGVTKYFTHAVFLAHDDYPKPHPYSIHRLFAKYLEYQQIEPHQLLYCGDSVETDLPVARAHGVAFVAVLGGRHTRADFLASGLPNSHIVENLGELLPLLKP